MYSVPYLLRACSLSSLPFSAPITHRPRLFRSFLAPALVIPECQLQFPHKLSQYLTLASGSDSGHRLAAVEFCQKLIYVCIYNWSVPLVSGIQFIRLSRTIGRKMREGAFLLHLRCFLLFMPVYNSITCKKKLARKNVLGHQLLFVLLFFFRRTVSITRRIERAPISRSKTVD